MAELEDKTGLIMTPFERNLEIWRQLWRVAEKSDLLLQIVDCRNPLLFMCSDLEEYAREIDPRKKCITVMNKSDLLSEKQRAAWVQYFKEKGIDYVFYSALSALKSAEEDAAEPKCKEGSSADESIEVYSASKLLDLINKEVSELDIRDRKAVVGFVGYPNVGKSSTINSLVGKKRQSVSSTPGKTKHFQTIHLSNSLIICDCPGLVFPSLATTKAELVCNGVLPIDQMRDYISPLALIIQRVPMGALESIYNIKLPIQEDVPIDEDLLEVTSRNFLRAYALSRGFTKSTQGNPDESRSARYILKDYVNAKITWCQPPPGCNEIEFNKDCYLGLTDGNLSSAQNPKDAKKMQKGSPQNDSLNGSLPDQKIENGAVNVRAYIIPNSMDRKSSIPFEEAKKMHKNTRRRQPKQRMAWTQDLL